MNIQLKFYAGALLAIGMLNGCAGENNNVVRQVDKIYRIPFLDVPVDYTIVDNFADQAPKTVAIIPFKYTRKGGANFEIGSAVSREIKPSIEQTGCVILRKVFYKYFSTLSYTDIDPSYIDAVLVEHGIKNIGQLYDIPHKKIGALLGADAIITGELENVGNLTAGIYSHTVLSGKISMYSVKTGNLLWSINHYESEKGGVIYKSGQVLDLIESQIQNVKLERSFTKVAEEFSRKAVNSIPDNEHKTAETQNTPQISSAVIENIGLKQNILLPGDKITVTMNGTPGLQATFDIGIWKSNIPMKEISAGKYQGTYWIQYGDQTSHQAIAVKLKNRFNIASSKFIDSNYTFTCKGKLLPAPKSFTAKFSPGTKSIRLQWEFNAEEIKYYQLYRSKNREPAFKLIQTLSKPQFEDKTINTEDNIYIYQVIAYDNMGNASLPGGPLEVNVK